ncbi:uncharacterized protein V6R79_012670 [Siganus canaliculatus]
MLGTLCSLIAALTYVDAVIVLTQMPAVHTVSSGQEVVLKCNIQRYDNAYVNWYKQVPGGSPLYVLGFHYSNSNSLNFGTGFSSDRFNLKYPSNVDYQFIIKRTETGDSAVYYCLTWDDTDKDQSVPFAEVSWFLAGTPVSSGISTSSAVQRPDQTFQISSYLDIQTSDWNKDKVYTCQVSVGSHTSEKNINKSDCATEE